MCNTSAGHPPLRMRLNEKKLDDARKLSYLESTVSVGGQREGGLSQMRERMLEGLECL